MPKRGKTPSPKAPARKSIKTAPAKRPKPAPAPMARRSGGGGQLDMTDYRHTEKRVNNPPAAMAHEGQAPKVAKARYDYNPHLPPVLRFDSTGKADKYPELIEAAGKRPLTAAEQKILYSALTTHEPWLEWSGKREQQKNGHFDVDPVVLHIHERVSAQAIVRAAMREDVQRDLFADPQQPYKEAIQFYKHPMDWANRLILGDSLQVMSSLARRENLAGKVQMIYMDPPYGIKFKSNFQPEVRKKEVKEKASDLTREAEMVRAFRDTWQLGVHSYLAYLRERLIASRDLLADGGSIFLQIGDLNVHVVRALMDEVFGVDNQCALITVIKTAGASSDLLACVADFVLWYAKDAERAATNYHQIYKSKNGTDDEASEYKYLLFPNGSSRSMKPSEVADPSSIPEGAERYRPTQTTSQRPPGSDPFEFRGKSYRPSAAQFWKTNVHGLTRLGRAERLVPRDESISYLRLLRDFPVVPLNNIWDDVRWGFDAKDKRYVVETNSKIIERCMLMSTKPGDLVLDPTCGGSGSPPERRNC